MKYKLNISAEDIPISEEQFKDLFESRLITKKVTLTLVGYVQDLKQVSYKPDMIHADIEFLTLHELSKIEHET
jgi:hypothetical protein